MLELMRLAEQAGEGPRVIDAQYVEQQVQAALAGPEPEAPPQPMGPTDDGHGQ